MSIRPFGSPWFYDHPKDPVKWALPWVTGPWKHRGPTKKDISQFLGSLVGRHTTDLWITFWGYFSPFLEIGGTFDHEIVLLYFPLKSKKILAVFFYSDLFFFFFLFFIVPVGSVSAGILSSLFLDFSEISGSIHSSNSYFANSHLVVFLVVSSK